VELQVDARRGVRYEGNVTALVLFTQAIIFGGCVALGMLTSATVECAFTPVVVAVDRAAEPHPSIEPMVTPVSTPAAEPCP
jgi:hypothetical protein